MYPQLQASGSPENHKPGYCADGSSGRQILDPLNNIWTPIHKLPKIIPWPQPEGIFTGGNRFHPIPFLQTIHTLYQQIYEEKIDASELSLELEAFVVLYAQHIIELPNGLNLWKIPTGLQVDPLGSSFVVEHLGQPHVRIDCLQDSTVTTC